MSIRITVFEPKNKEFELEFRLFVPPGQYGFPIFTHTSFLKNGKNKTELFLELLSFLAAKKESPKVCFYILDYILDSFLGAFCSTLALPPCAGDIGGSVAHQLGSW